MAEGQDKAHQLRLVCGGATDVGLVREGNEDAFVWHEALSLASVADGMGGHLAGQVASEMALETMVAQLIEPPLRRRWWHSWRRVPAGHLAGPIEAANRAIWRRSNRDPECEGMGTTVVALRLCEGQLHIAHVGDSRIYRWYAGTLTQITSDHSLVNAYIQKGLLSEEEAEDFPLRHVIVRGLGLAPSVVVDEQVSTPQIGARYLLCSDGLTDLVDDERISGQLEELEPPQTTAEALVALALEAGGLDNVTVVVVDVLEDS